MDRGGLVRPYLIPNRYCFSSSRPKLDQFLSSLDYYPQATASEYWPTKPNNPSPTYRFPQTEFHTACLRRPRTKTSAWDRSTVLLSLISVSNKHLGQKLVVGECPRTIAGRVAEGFPIVCGRISDGIGTDGVRPICGRSIEEL